MRRISVALVVVLMASVRCQSPTDPQPLQRFDTCENLQLFLEDQILHPSVETGFDSGGLVGCASPDALNEVPKGGGDFAIGGGESRSFTTTNTQEANVDEPDFVKNNGDVIFVLRRGQMIIMSAWPADSAHILSTTSVAGTPFNMLFDDDDGRALVFSHFTENGKQQTLVKMFDVADASAPHELRSTLIDGEYVDARSVNQQVMLVSRAFLNVDVQLDNAPFADDDNRARLRAAGIGRIFPEVADTIIGQDSSPRVSQAVACENTYAPSRTDGHNILLVHTFDMTKPDAALLSTAVVAGFSNVYASTKSIYLASTEYADGGYFTPQFNTTRVHKLDGFTGDGAATYKATGLFLGTIKDELSLDEGPDGSLRMVLTDNSKSSDYEQQTTSLLVVQEDGTNLKEVARVSDLGRGESVESVRFLGDKAYVVTYPSAGGFFLNSDGVPQTSFTDPLAIVDLADPKSPKLRGEVEVGGYSAYIHPVDDDHILTVGVDTDPTTGLMKALSLMLFDVSDADKPALMFRHDFGDANTGSEALVDRHAFTYFPDPDVASSATFALPVQRFSNDGLMNSSTLAVFTVDLDAGIVPIGEIEQKFLFIGLDGVERSNAPCTAVRRSVMIRDPVEGAFVYAVSTGGVTAAQLSDGLPTSSTVQLLRDGDSVCDSLGSPL